MNESCEDMIARLKREIIRADDEYNELMIQMATLKLMLYFEESNVLDVRKVSDHDR